MPATQIVSGAITAVILFAITLPWVRHQFRKSDPTLVRLVSVALPIKILAAIARYLVAYQLYGGVADSAQYTTAGTQLVHQFRQFDFHADVGRVVGTGFIKILTGIVFAYTGVSEIGGYFIFSWLGFLGLWLFFRAFRIAVPEGDARRYAWLIFLLPSMLFWPSEIGKEAWMTLGLGLSAYGAARIMVHRPFGYLLMLIGCAASAAVRPHVTVLFLAAFFVAFLLRRDRTLSTSGARRTRRGSKLFGIVVIVTAMLIGVTRANTFFSADGLQGGSNQGLTGILSGTSLRTSQGGSHFAPASLSAPQTIPYAVLSVTFRPFPWEANNVQSLLASAEGTFLIYLLWRSRRRLRHLWPWMVARPYLMLCLVYSLLFAFGFSAVGNYGILDRERVMQFPFFVALLALPAGLPGRTGDTTGVPLPAPDVVMHRVQALEAARLATSPLAAEADLVSK
jgi:hypothetical protein